MRKSSKLKNYRLICPHPSLRYKCHYCGLSAPAFDFSPPAEIASQFDEDEINYDPVKVPCCKECLSLSKKLKNWRLPDRFDEIKKLIAEKYKTQLESCEWEAAEVDELDYSLRTLVKAHNDYHKLIKQRLAWGVAHQESRETGEEL